MAISSETFRELFASFASTVTIVTAYADDAPSGATVTACSSVSAQPPLIMVALGRESRTLSQILRAGRFGVNVLADHQEAVARLFSQSTVNKFSRLDWILDGDVPCLPDSCGFVAARLSSELTVGDHVLIVGSIEKVSCTSQTPLLYHRRQFARCEQIGVKANASVA
ncbi:flavin reductase family protein [Cupriavidus necator]|uniref:flavin reductase family protein n=1 Tax=Cupriavidus necator TaxID=106590 RepID=UPI0009B69056